MNESIVQRLLGDPVDMQLDIAWNPSGAITSDVELNGHVSAFLNALSQPFEGRYEPELLEHRQPSFGH